MKKAHIVCVVAACVLAGVAHAGDGMTPKQTDVMKQLLGTYAKQAKLAGPQAFSAQTGREFYVQQRTIHAKDFSCAGCHTENPTREGKHLETKKSIKPLAPAANPERFTSVKKVEKNFAEHCFDLYDRDCRAEEKGHFVAYLMSAK